MTETIMTIQEIAEKDLDKYNKYRIKERKLYYLSPEGEKIKNPNYSTLEWLKYYYSSWDKTEERLSFTLEIFKQIQKIKTAGSHDEKKAAEANLLALYCKIEEHGNGKLHLILRDTRRKMILGDIEYATPAAEPSKLATRAIKDMKNYLSHSKQELKLLEKLKRHLGLDHVEARIDLMNKILSLATSITLLRDEGSFSTALLELSNKLELELLEEFYADPYIEQLTWEGSVMREIIEETQNELIYRRTAASKEADTPINHNQLYFIDIFRAEFVKIYHKTKDKLSSDAYSLAKTASEVCTNLSEVVDHVAVKAINAVANPFLEFYQKFEKDKKAKRIRFLETDEDAEIELLAEMTAKSFIYDYYGEEIQHLSKETCAKYARGFANYLYDHSPKENYQFDGTTSALIDCLTNMAPKAVSYIQSQKKPSSSDEKSTLKDMKNKLYYRVEDGHSHFYKPKDAKSIKSLVDYKLTEMHSYNLYPEHLVEMNPDESQDFWAERILNEIFSKYSETTTSNDSENTLAKNINKHKSTLIKTHKPQIVEALQKTDHSTNLSEDGKNFRQHLVDKFCKLFENKIGDHTTKKTHHLLPKFFHSKNKRGREEQFNDHDKTKLKSPKRFENTTPTFSYRPLP